MILKVGILNYLFSSSFLILIIPSIVFGRQINYNVHTRKHELYYQSMLPY